MATIINNPGDSSGGGAGLAIAVIAIIVALALFFLYGLPALRKTDNGTTINVPDKIEIDTNKQNY